MPLGRILGIVQTLLGVIRDLDYRLAVDEGIPSEYSRLIDLRRTEAERGAPVLEPAQEQVECTRLILIVVFVAATSDLRPERSGLGHVDKVCSIHCRHVWELPHLRSLDGENGPHPLQESEVLLVHESLVTVILLLGGQPVDSSMTPVDAFITEFQ